MNCQGQGKEKIGSYHLKGMEFQFVWEDDENSSEDGGDGCTKCVHF